MTIMRKLLVVGLLTALSAGCGNGGGWSTAQMAAAKEPLVQQQGYTQTQAECTVKGIASQVTYAQWQAWMHKDLAGMMADTHMFAIAAKAALACGVGPGNP